MAKKAKTGKVSFTDMRSLINKKHGQNIAYDLTQENPTEVTGWIPTGSRWLDAIICRGKYAGIPIGKMTEIAGLESTGKSFLAAQIAANAQKQGINVVYFDSESAIDPGFLENAGCDLESLIYIQAESVEFVLETIEEFIGSVGENLLFIWDSIALTPCNSDIEGDFNPQSSMAVKARVLSKGLQKLTLPLANANSTLLALNQLKTNITRSVSEAMTEPLVTPGGKSLAYAYSLRIWLTSRKAKNSFVVDDKGYRIGSEVKTTLKKSRFGSQGRTCTFRILWGDSENIGVMDEESWFDAVKTSDRMVQRGAWYTLVHQDGTETKFQPSKWLEMLQDEKFKNSVLQLIDEEVIMKFDERLGNAEDFYEEDDESGSESNQPSY
jgi:recombination protein RecA